LAKKKKKSKRKKQSKQWFSFGSTSIRKKKAGARTAQTSFSWRPVFIGLAILCVLAAIAVGLVLLDRYIRAASDIGTEVGPLVLVDKPFWFNSELVQKVETAVGGDRFELDETAAKTVADNLRSLAWLYDVKVRTTADSVQISAQYRRPVGLIKQSRRMYYIDQDLVVLDYVPISGLSIVQIKSFSSRPPDIGQRWDADDITAAVQLLIVLEGMDAISTPEKPLLNEIASVDVSNFDGRRSSRQAHIVLHAKDGTQVNWGAAYGRSAQYLEATEKEKVAMLYEFYKQHGTIQAIVKYIELRNPQETIPRPTIR
jgi:hypothetical protein